MKKADDGNENGEEMRMLVMVVMAMMRAPMREQ